MTHNLWQMFWIKKYTKLFVSMTVNVKHTSAFAAVYHLIPGDTEVEFSGKTPLLFFLFLFCFVLSVLWIIMCDKDYQIMYKCLKICRDNYNKP